MRGFKSIALHYTVFFFVICCIPSFPQANGLKTISENELRLHLEFITADEFRGRETPSPELEICNLYLARWAKNLGLDPIMPDGSYFQSFPLNVTYVSPANTTMRLMSESGDRIFFYEKSFAGTFRSSGTFSGDVVFLGFGLIAPDKGWDDCKDIDLSGKVVVILDGGLPEGHGFGAGADQLWTRANRLRGKGAAAVLSVINPELEDRRAAGENIFYTIPRGRMAVSYESQRTARRSRSSRPTEQEPPARPPLPFTRAEIDHGTATAILDITKSELREMFARIGHGEPVTAKELAQKRIELSVRVESRPDSTRNVLGVARGTHPTLKNEYVVVCAHQDHLGIRNGEVMNGADDNGSGTVALLEIAQAVMAERPKRSVIFAWYSGEERGMLGSHYFVNNSPVPIEKISACLNLDMISRNDPGKLYLVASDLLSSELDGTIHTVNKGNHINFDFDYTYSNRKHPQRVYYRSDQYPHIRFGIPSVWLFCGFTEDYHTVRDDLEFVDFSKMLKVTKLAYLTAFEIANMSELLKLDVNPDVTSRGKHNLSVASIK